MYSSFLKNFFTQITMGETNRFWLYGKKKLLGEIDP